MALTATELNNVLDQIGKIYVCLLGDGAAYGIGDGTYGASAAAEAIKTTVVDDFASNESILVVNQSAITLASALTVTALCSNAISDIISRISSNAGVAGIANVSNLDTYLYYLNVTHATKWQALQSPNTRLALETIGGNAPNVANFYEEILTGFDHADGLGRYTASTFTDGDAIDGTKHVGGFGYLNVDSVTGADTVTVEGNGWDPASAGLVTGVTWTAAVAGTGLVALAPGGASPAPADTLLQDVTDITVGGSISAIDVTVECHRPIGRPLIA